MHNRCVFHKVFFLSFEFSYPSPGQTQALCRAYEIWQFYSPRLDDCRLVFFLEFNEAPGNKLTGSRMILKCYSPPKSCEELPLISFIRNKVQKKNSIEGHYRFFALEEWYSRLGIISRCSHSPRERNYLEGTLHLLSK